MNTVAKSTLAVAAFLPLGLLFEVDWTAVVGRPVLADARSSAGAFAADTLRDKRHAGGKAGCEKGAKGGHERRGGAADEGGRSESEARETAAARVAS
ncbi:MAG TPA: hypothetical protein VIC56_09605 [Gemmatimonadota bacterium]|jgi:hypothetical protein